MAFEQRPDGGEGARLEECLGGGHQKREVLETGAAPVPPAVCEVSRGGAGDGESLASALGRWKAAGRF